MKTFKEVREFDIITCNEKYKNDSKYDKDNNKYIYINESIFEELTNFIYEFNASEENSDILEFIKIEYRRNVGNIIRIKNYVGLIELKSGFQLQILPKISLGNDNEENTKKIFIKMIKSMKDFPSKVFTSANLNIDKMNLYEIFINMYLQEVRKLIKKGLKSSYVEIEKNIPYFKGKLEVNKHINLNTVHKERFYMKYDEYQLNRPENKIIKSTLIKLQKISVSSENIKQIKQLLTFFELVEMSINYDKDFSKIKIDRTTKEYDILMKWSKVFLLNKSFTTFSGKNYSRALLFPMEKVFESYVAKYVKKFFKDYEVKTQHKGKYLFNKFALRPDIVLKRKDESIIIMDTKWKRLEKKRNYGISQNDMYQMYVYAKKYETSEVYLLYPKNEEIKPTEQIKFIDNNGEVCVYVFFVNVEKIEESIQELLDMCNKHYYQNKNNIIGK